MLVCMAQVLRRDRARSLARALAVGRIGIGAVSLIAPGPACRLWVGPTADDTRIKMFGRIVAGRELALGLGALLALQHDAPVRGWMEAASLADAVDCTVTALRFGTLPPKGRWMFLAGAAAASAAEAVAARSVDA